MGTSEVHVVRHRNKPMIEYWDVTTTDKAPEIVIETRRVAATVRNTEP